ncbi:MAG: DGQHR domain-containing protein [Sphingobacteriales bacterium]|nr:MAG: DGQHR domain-containing protein [Sphingobacteriales bacterium]
MNNKLILPCLKGRAGDWFYYTALMTYKEVANRVKLPREIDEKYSDPKLKLGEWIQRDLEKSRTARIVDYLTKNEQRFFNSLILGIFEGSPAWSEINVSGSREGIDYEEETEIYLSESIGILTLNGDENIFAIDGQHRAVGIREAFKKKPSLGGDEVPVIIIAHRTTTEGNIRTRRLFSTLNRYAKPVSKSDNIALSEDDNCAIITRDIIDTFDMMRGKVLINKSPSISPENKTDFTNIRSLYDLVERLLTDQKVYNFEVFGYEHYDFTNNRLSDSVLKTISSKIKIQLTNILTSIPSFNSYVKTGYVDRLDPKASLIFRPIGQTILFDVIKVAEYHGKGEEALKYFSKDNFKISNKIWREVFWDDDIDNIRTETARVKFATLLILEHLEIPIKRTKKDKEVFDSFGFDPKKI